VDEPIEELYFNWLCAKVLDFNVRIYFDLMHILHTTEFVWLVPEDQNRAEDGLELRTYFLREHGIDSVDASIHEWFSSPCSFLEMLIAFSNRASFQTDEPTSDWFWRFLNTIRLDEYRQVSIDDEILIRDILHTVIWRTYREDGHGGMFPMNRTLYNQREVEIWYQFCEYLQDQGLI
jgi:hypothetical protein